MIKNGKFSLSLAAIAVVAFAFALLEEVAALILVLVFSLLAEKDDWLNLQVFQALLLALAYQMLALLRTWIYSGLTSFISWLDIYRGFRVIDRMDSLIWGLLYIAFIVFVILAMVRLIRGQDADLPFFARLAGTGLIKTRQGRGPHFNGPGKTSSQPAPSPPPEPVPNSFQDSAFSQGPGKGQGPSPGSDPQARTQPVPDQDQVVEKVDSLENFSGHCGSCGAPLGPDALFCRECGAKNNA